MSEKRVIDWERIEFDYRAGVLSLREMAQLHTVSVAYIRKRADAEDWERDLAAKIQAKADALVHKAECTAGAQCTEKNTIEANALAIANVRIGHRTVIKRVSDHAQMLLGRLENDDELELLQQIKGTKELADTLKTLIGLEREAWSLNASPDLPATSEDSGDDTEFARRLAFVLARGAAALPTVH